MARNWQRFQRCSIFSMHPHELAASCGILLWLVTFVSVVPVGLLLAHRERLSLRKLSEESEQEEARAELLPVPPANLKGRTSLLQSVSQ